MNATREKLIAEARRWIGTPFKHQGRLRGVGVDCIGLIVQPARDVGIDCIDEAGYSRQSNAEHTLEMLEVSFVQIDKSDVLPGDVLFFWFETPEQPHHFAYVTDVGVLHAYEQAHTCVVETRRHAWWESHIHSAWRFKCWVT